MFGRLISHVSIPGLIAIALCLSCLGLEAKAQGCGPSITRVSVRDDKGWPVINARVELVGPDTESAMLREGWLKKTDSNYLISFYDAKPRGNHILKISKEDLLPVEIPLSFGEAQFRVFEVVLSTKDAGKPSRFRQLFPVTGATSTEDGLPISDVGVTAVGKGGVEYKAKSDAEGRYQLALPPGRYILKFTRMFFVDHAVEADVVFVDHSLNLDVTLKGRGPTSH